MSAVQETLNTPSLKPYEPGSKRLVTGLCRDHIGPLWNPKGPSIEGALTMAHMENVPIGPDWETTEHVDESMDRRRFISSFGFPGCYTLPWRSYNGLDLALPGAAAPKKAYQSSCLGSYGVLRGKAVSVLSACRFGASWHHASSSAQTNVYAYMYICMHACIRAHIHTYIHTYVHMYVRTYIHTYTPTRKCVPIYIYSYSFSCMHRSLNSYSCVGQPFFDTQETQRRAHEGFKGTFWRARGFNMMTSSMVYRSH